MRTTLVALSTLVLWLMPQMILAAPASLVAPPPLNKVTMHLTSQQWVETSTANVVVQVNASLNEQGLETAHSTINEKLAKISDQAKWHITRFDRNKNQSGLEELTVTAEAR